MKLAGFAVGAWVCGIGATFLAPILQGATHFSVSLGDAIAIGGLPCVFVSAMWVHLTRQLRHERAERKELWQRTEENRLLAEKAVNVETNVTHRIEALANRMQVLYDGSERDWEVKLQGLEDRFERTVVQLANRLDTHLDQLGRA